MLRQTANLLAKTGQKGQTNNPRVLPRIGSQRARNKGLRCLPGDWIHKNGWIAKQSIARTIYYPGQHTKANAYNDILAAKDGRVELTKEVYIPHPSSLDAEIVKKMPRGSIWFRNVVHIIPDEKKYKREFRLKSLL